MATQHLALVSALALAAVSMAAGEENAKTYPDRWVYVSRNLSQDKHVEDIKQIVATSKEHGLNGLLLAASLDTLSLWKPDRLARLEQVKAICKEGGIELIPQIWSVGYGGGILGYDKNLAEGLPCRDVPFLAKGHEAQFVPDPAVKIANGGFEEFEGHKMSGYQLQEKPGDVSFADTTVFKGGKASLRFENFGAYPHGHGRVMQEVRVRPWRQYRLSCWVKTEALEPASAFAIQIYGPAHPIAPVNVSVPSTTDWREASFVFNSLQLDKVKIYAGVWGGKSGKFWLDELALEEMALVNVLRRPGTPLTVTSADGQTTYEEGKDFEQVVDDKLNLSRPRKDNPPIRLTAQSRIQDGQRLKAGYYHGMAIHNGQVTACMSEPKLYEIFKQSAAELKKQLNPQKFFLSMDEIRAGGTCAACEARHLSMAEILGDCVTKQVQIIREANPQAQVYIWSDMLDPNHNAHGDYYLVQGDFAGSWKFVPKDLVICCWYFEKRAASLKFFSELGFETLAGAYYDGDTLDNIRGWLEAINQTPKCRGIMYTTWQDKYRLLPDFGDVVGKESRPK